MGSRGLTFRRLAMGLAFVIFSLLLPMAERLPSLAPKEYKGPISCEKKKANLEYLIWRVYR